MSHLQRPTETRSTNTLRRDLPKKTPLKHLHQVLKAFQANTGGELARVLGCTPEDGVTIVFSEHKEELAQARLIEEQLKEKNNNQ